MVLESLISDQQQPTIVVVYVNNACLHEKRLSWFWKYRIYYQHKHFSTFYHSTDNIQQNMDMLQAVQAQRMLRFVIVPISIHSRYIQIIQVIMNLSRVRVEYLRSQSQAYSCIPLSKTLNSYHFCLLWPTKYGSVGIGNLLSKFRSVIDTVPLNRMYSYCCFVSTFTNSLHERDSVAVHTIAFGNHGS